MVKRTTLLGKKLVREVAISWRSVGKISFLPSEVVNKRTFHHFMFIGATEKICIEPTPPPSQLWCDDLSVELRSPFPY